MKYSTPTIAHVTTSQNKESTRNFNQEGRKRNKAILLAMKDVARKMRNYNKVNLAWDEDIGQIMKWGKLTKVQACILAQCVTILIDNEDWISFIGFARYLNTEPSNYLCYTPSLAYLVEKGFLVLRYQTPYTPGAFNKDSQFCLPESVENDICYNRKFTPYFPPLPAEKPSLASYVLRARDFFVKSDLKMSTLFSLVRTYFKTVPFLTQFLPENGFDTHDAFQGDGGICLQFFTAAACNLYVADSSSICNVLDKVDITNTERVANILRSFKNGDNWFLHNKIFEVVEDDYMNNMSLKWGQTAYDELFKEDMYLIFSPSSISSVSTVKCVDIKEKPLFYNEENIQDINRLGELLTEESYVKIVERLEKENMPKGLIVLLYGPPGTGKTETVMQLAKKTERDILHVNVEELKSCWVGSSEKNTKKLFDGYKRYRADKKPILLFNEADSIISKRSQITDQARAVDKMENSIQNIILEAMESFEGIMVLTSNLEDSFDRAFDRRILFKLKLENPVLDVRQKIWQSSIPALTNDESRDLAESYLFSGAQIENIRKKITLDNVLYGKNPSIETIKDFCNKEELFKDDGKKVIGFR